MSNHRRIIEHPVLGKLENRRPISFNFDGTTYQGYEGDTIAAALLAQGIRTLRVHEESGTPRGIYCNIGHCFECRLTVDQVSGVRACLTEITEGMQVESGQIQPMPLKKEGNLDLPRTYSEYTQRLAQNKEDKVHE